MWVGFRYGAVVNILLCSTLRVLPYYALPSEVNPIYISSIRCHYSTGARKKKTVKALSYFTVKSTGFSYRMYVCACVCTCLCASGYNSVILLILWAATSENVPSGIWTQWRFTVVAYMYSRTSMARTSLGLWKFVRDMGSSSHWGLIMAQGRETNGLLYNNCMLSVLIRIASLRRF